RPLGKLRRTFGGLVGAARAAHDGEACSRDTAGEPALLGSWSREDGDGPAGQLTHVWTPVVRMRGRSPGSAPRPDERTPRRRQGREGASLQFSPSRSSTEEM